MIPPISLDGLRAQKQFFELMRRLEAGLTDVDLPLRHRRRPAWLSLEQAAAMHFASTEVARVNHLEAAPTEGRLSAVLQVIIRHFGLFAPYGPLPLHITEHAMVERRFERNRAFESFVNLISADMAWLQYLSATAMHPVISREQGRHTFQRRVAGPVRALPESSPGPVTLAQHVAACHASFPGVYLRRQRSTATLKHMLAAYFDVPLRLLPRAPRWLEVPEAAQQDRALGLWRLGSRFADAQTLDIEVGPLDAANHAPWGRRAEATQAMVALVKDYSRTGLTPSVHLLIKTHPGMATRVGRMRLGADAWLRPKHGLRRVTVYAAQ